MYFSILQLHPTPPQPCSFTFPNASFSFFVASLRRCVRFLRGCTKGGKTDHPHSRLSIAPPSCASRPDKRVVRVRQDRRGGLVSSISSTLAAAMDYRLPPALRARTNELSGPPVRAGQAGPVSLHNISGSFFVASLHRCVRLVSAFTIQEISRVAKPPRLRFAGISGSFFVASLRRCVRLVSALTIQEISRVARTTRCPGPSGQEGRPGVINLVDPRSSNGLSPSSRASRPDKRVVRATRPGGPSRSRFPSQHLRGVFRCVVAPLREAGFGLYHSGDLSGGQAAPASLRWHLRVVFRCVVAPLREIFP